MKITRLSLLALACLALVVACARNDDATPTGGAPATRPAGAAQAAATQPSMSLLLIDKTAQWFPRHVSACAFPMETSSPGSIARATILLAP